MSEFEGTTLALQHYYDILKVSRKLPFLTQYRATEQPFGRRMSVWMAADPYSKPLSGTIRDRLDSAMLKNRALSSRHIPRILDFGSGEGKGFVVTDEIIGESLYDYLRAKGPLAPWQLIRLAEQLTEIVKTARDADFHFLCLSSQTLFLTDESRFELISAPLGLGLHRAELLQLKDLPVVPELMRHLPPWEFESPVESANSIVAETPSSSSLSFTSIDGVQDVSLDAQEIDSDSPSSMTVSAEIPSMSEEGFDADVYGVAAILYEALSCAHPYFADQAEVCEVVFKMKHEGATELSTLCDAPAAACDSIMKTLQSPEVGSLSSLLSDLCHAYGPSVCEEARHAEKPYLEAPETNTKTTLKPKQKHTLPHPRILLGVAALLLILLTALITHHFSSQRHPVDLFALPEILPRAEVGVDVVLPELRSQEKTTVFITNLSDGTLVRLGELPIIYRDQPTSSQLSFVLLDEKGRSRQVSIISRDTPGLQIVNVEK